MAQIFPASKIHVNSITICRHYNTCKYHKYFRPLKYMYTENCNHKLVVGKFLSVLDSVDSRSECTSYAILS